MSPLSAGVDERSGAPAGPPSSVAIVRPPAPDPSTVNGPLATVTVPDGSLPSAESESVLLLGGAGNVGGADTEVVSVAEVLSAVFGSGVALLTVAWLTSLPVAVAVTTTDVLALADSDAIEQVSVPVAMAQPVVDVAALFAATGNVSLTVTELAASGPALVTVIVYVTVALTYTAVGPLSVIPKSALVGEGFIDADADEAPLVPLAFVAVTVNVYAVPLVSPLTTHEVLGAVATQVAPPGDAVTR